MQLLFTWDPEKAEQIARKHGISFDEARSVFGDPLAATFPDPDHSEVENRELTIGYSTTGRVLVVSHTQRGLAVRNTMREWRPAMSDETMNNEDDMRDEYDFSSGGVVGQYYERYREGTNVVLLDPDVAGEFPDSESVNRTLRRVLRHRRKGGISSEASSLRGPDGTR